MTWFLFFLVTFVLDSRCSAYPEVITRLGKIQGKIVYLNDLPVRTFQGIPFAKPPIGEYRFRKPQPANPWNGTLVAQELPAGCVQYSTIPFLLIDNNPVKSQDCLYLNVWTPDRLDKSRKTAVMFWIHGGAFKFLSSSIDVFDGRALAALGNVIVVTTNYRLGPEGFLNSGTDDAPGNMGLHDILQSLRWVRSNIGSFGGDCENVSLFGQSAGAIAIGMLMTSPLARGLFQRAVLASGAPTSLDAEDNGKNLRVTRATAELVGCSDDEVNLDTDPKAVIDCMRGIDGVLLSKTVTRASNYSHRPLYPNFGDDILPRNARLSFIEGDFRHIDLLMGDTREEGTDLIVLPDPDFFGPYGEKDPQVNLTYGKTLIRKAFKDFTDVEKVVEHYLGGLREDDYEEIRYQVATASGDFGRLCPMEYLAESVARGGNHVSYYFFTHRPTPTPWAPWMGVVHFDDTFFVFGYPLRYPENYTAEEQTLSRRMIEIWTTFAKTGKQVLLPWPQYSKAEPFYHTLDTAAERIKKGPHRRNCDFFRKYFGF